MPYTPPSQRSPAASQPESPPRSRDGSWVKPLPDSSPFLSGPRPALPRSNSSTSYLHRHRRSPSTPEVSRSYSSPDSSNENSKSSASSNWAKAPGASLRQSPPPLNNLKIPTGAVMSPPDSASNSSDDEGLTMPERGRKLENLAELQAAISVIEQQRESSPTRKQAEVNAARNTLGLGGNEAQSPATLQLPSSRPPLSKEARKISHSRSATEPDVYLNMNGQSPTFSSLENSSDSDLDEETAAGKPPMLRKKSGELVRPALRPPSSRRRPSSMPGTPTFSKAVHFSNNLEHVRHFLQVDRPLAVSAETSPVEQYDTETEFPFEDEAKSRSHEWEIRCANFPPTRTEPYTAPVSVERVFLSGDKKTLIGTVAVQNLAFHKLVIARFTFDHWKTTSEVTAEYSQDIRRENAGDGLDRFNFNIRLADQVNLGSKTLFFCVRYLVNGQEFWDSNRMMNFQVDFSKKQVAAKSTKQDAGNEAMRHLSGLPRSSRSPQQSPNRKVFDDFGRGTDAHWDKDFLPRSQSASSILNETTGTPIKFRSKAAGNALEDHRPAKGAGQAFAHRYDFSASLSAAMTAASTALGERSGLPPQQPQAAQEKSKAPKSAPVAAPASVNSAPSAMVNEKPPASSLSYNELLEKYCFFGSAKSSPTGRHENGPDKTQQDGFNFDGSVSGTPSPVPSPPNEEVQAAAEPVTGRINRSVSPSRSELSSRAASPNSFGYPYHQPLVNGFAPSTAIRG